MKNNLEKYSDVLANGLKEVAADLRTIDLIDIISYIRCGSYATIEDLVHSSTEFFFKPGTLNFAWNAGIDLAWGEPPVITMGMEFRHGAISVFFDLTLWAVEETVKVRAILFEGPDQEPADLVSQLGAAIAEARLPSRSAAWPGTSVWLGRTGDA